MADSVVGWNPERAKKRVAYAVDPQHDAVTQSQPVRYPGVPRICH
jgi:hypothetical protein